MYIRINGGEERLDKNVTFTTTSLYYVVSSSQLDFRRFNLSLTSLKVGEISPRKHAAYKWLPRMSTYV